MDMSMHYEPLDLTVEQWKRTLNHEERIIYGGYSVRERRTAYNRWRRMVIREALEHSALFGTAELAELFGPMEG